MALDGHASTVCLQLLRLLFVAVAGPLVLCGTILSGASVQLQKAGIRYFEYALVEEEGAAASHAAAGTDVAAATEDEVMALDLEAKAAEEQGIALEEEREAVQDEAGTGRAEEGAEAGEALEAAEPLEASEAAAAAEAGDAEGAGEAIRQAVERASQEAAAEAAEGVAVESSEVAAGAAVAAAEGSGAAAAGGIIGAENAGLLAAEGAGIAAGEGVGAGVAAAEGAGLVTVGATAGGTEVASAGLATPVVAVGAAAAVAAIEAPRLVDAARAEWSAAGEEVQGFKDEALAAEKEAEAKSLEAAAGVFETGAAEAQHAALASASAGTGFVIAAQLCQLAALAVQAPVAAAVSLHKALQLGSAVGLCGGAAHAASSSPSARVLQGSLRIAAPATLALGMGLLLLNPWMEAVAEAARWERSSAIDVGPRLEAAVEEVMQRLQLGHQRRLNWIWDSIRGATTDAAHKVQQGSIGAAKRVVAGQPNVETTTVRPLATPAPPEEVGLWSFVKPGVAAWVVSLIHWTGPVLGAVFFTSCIFALLEALVALGRHGPSMRCQHVGCRRALGRVLQDVLAQWMACLGALVAVWMIGILFATNFDRHADDAAQPSSPWEEEATGLSTGLLAFLISSLAFALGGCHAWVLAMQPCACPGCLAAYYCPPEEASWIARQAASATGCMLSTVTLCVGGFISLVEAPLLSVSLAWFRSLASSWWLLGVVPWELLAHRTLRRLPDSLRPLARLHGSALGLLACALAGVVLWLLLLARRASEPGRAACGGEDDSASMTAGTDSEAPSWMGSYASSTAYTEDARASQKAKHFFPAMAPVYPAYGRQFGH